MNSDLEMEKCNLAHQMKRLPHPSGEESAESNLSEPPVRQSVVGRVSLAVRAEACNLRVLIGTVRLDVQRTVWQQQLLDRPLLPVPRLFQSSFLWSLGWFPIFGVFQERFYSIRCSGLKESC